MNNNLTEKEINEVMKYFSCDEEMAKTIISSSIVNGEYSAIQRMCKCGRRENDA